MADILIVTGGLAGILYPSLELARRLEQAGHRVTCASRAEAQPAARGVDIPFVALKESRYADFLQSDQAVGYLQRWRSLSARRGAAVQSLGLAEFGDTVQAHGKDLVLIDVEQHGQIIQSAGLGARVALLNPFVSIWNRPGLPPPHHRAIPGRGWRGSRSGMALLWGETRLRRRVRRAQAWWRHAGCDPVSVYRRLAGEGGFDFEARTDFRQWQIPFTYRDLPVLCLHAREFEFPHAPRDGVHYLGPLVSGQRADHRTTPECRQRIDAAVARIAAAGPRSRLVYAGFGSILAAGERIMQSLLAAARQRPEWEFVISAGRAADRHPADALPDNVTVCTWAPQTELLQHASAAVIHGGINTVDECVWHGVPMVIYRARATDIAGATSRAVYHGVAIEGDAPRDDANALLGHLDRLLGEPAFAESVSRLRTAYRAYPRDQVPERTVESLLA